MGLHYINFDEFLDGGVLDIAKPEALLFEPQADGSLRLTAVEYVIPERDRPRTNPAPVIFGHEMMFHPEFAAWALHVWLWRHNPYGIFADVNPEVSCQFAQKGQRQTSSTRRAETAIMTLLGDDCYEHYSGPGFPAGSKRNDRR